MDCDIIRRSFNNFYNHFDKKYFTVLNMDINKLIELQISNFIDTFGKEKNEIEKKYFKLAKLHFGLGISCFDYIQCFEKLKNTLLEELSTSEKLSKEFFKDFYNFFNTINNCTSLYYLQKLIDEDYFLLKNYVSCSKDNEAKHVINEHINWVKNILEKIKNPNKNLHVELDYQKCPLSKWIKNKNSTYFLKDVSRKELERIHKNIHNSAEEIFFYLKENNYYQILLRYSYFLKKSEFLVLIIVSKFAEFEMEESIVDPLTKTLNRHNLEKVLANTIETSYYSQQPITIAMLDIDNFKYINDTYGHQIGDFILKEVAKAIKNNIRTSDFLFRYGGEEFLIILTGANKKAGFKVTEKIRRIIEESKFYVKNKPINITVSIGAVTINANTKRKKINVLNLIEKADTNLYKAKKNGKNKVVI